MLSGKALEVAPLRQRRDGRVTQVNEGLTEYHWDGRRAIGHLGVPGAETPNEPAA